MPCHINYKAAIFQVVYTGQEKKTTKTHWNQGHPNSMAPTDTMTNLISKKQTGPRNSTRLDDYDPSDSTFSDHYPALLDEPVHTQEGDSSKLETVQEPAAATNAAADMSRRTWTQARQLMKDVHRSRGCFPVSNGNMKRQVTRQERTLQQRKRKTSGQEQRKRQGETSWTMSLVARTSLGS